MFESRVTIDIHDTQVVLDSLSMVETFTFAYPVDILYPTGSAGDAGYSCVCLSCNTQKSPASVLTTCDLVHLPRRSLLESLHCLPRFNLWISESDSDTATDSAVGASRCLNVAMDARNPFAGQNLTCSNNGTWWCSFTGGITDDAPFTDNLDMPNAIKTRHYSDRQCYGSGTDRRQAARNPRRPGSCRGYACIFVV